MIARATLKKDGTVSIDGLSKEQFKVLSDCLKEVKEHAVYDSISDLFWVSDMKMALNDTEIAALHTIRFLK